MNSKWILLPVFSLFCIGYAAEDSATTAPLPALNPEYSAPAPAAQPEKTDMKPVGRQVYRRKLPTGIKSLSDEPVSESRVYYPRGEKDPKQKTETSGIAVKDNSHELPRWRASQPPVRKSLPRVTNFRPAYSCSGSSCRKIRYTRSPGVRVYYRNSSSCSRSSCGTQVIIYRTSR